MGENDINGAGNIRTPADYEAVAEPPRKKRRYIRRKPFTEKICGAPAAPEERKAGRPRKAGRCDASLGQLRERWEARRAQLIEGVETLQAEIAALEIKLEVLADVEKSVRAIVR